MTNITDKLNVIISTYIENGAKVWDIGTDFYKSWILFLDNIKDVLKHTNWYYSINNSYIEIKQSYEIPGKDRYKIIFLNNNITPIHKIDKIASKGAIRQYLQIGSSLGFIDFNENDTIEDNSRFKLLPDIFECDSLTERLIESLFFSINTPIRFKRNLGFTLFLCLILLHDKGLFDGLDPNLCVESIRSKIDFFKTTKLFLNQEITQDYLWKVYGLKIKKYNWNGCNTYITAISKILNFKNNSFKKIVDILFSMIKNDKYNYYEFLNKSFEEVNNKENKNKHYLCKKDIDFVKQVRGQLRKNIKLERVNTEMDIIYSDITNSKPNEKYVSDMDACHIFDIKYIIKELEILYKKYSYEDILNNLEIKIKIDDLKESSTDFNNGILLDKSSHKLFDERIVWFDENGKLNYIREAEEKVRLNFGDNYNNVYIKPEVLTNKMKMYLQKRLSIK